MKPLVSRGFTRIQTRNFGLGALSARQRTAVVLRYFHDLPDTEIAAVLGCRATTARSLISRGMAVMRKGSAGMDEAIALGRERTS